MVLPSAVEPVVEPPAPIVEPPAAPFGRAANGQPYPPFEQPLVPREETRGMVLMYHTIHPRIVAERSVYPWRLELHVKQLRAQGTEIIAMSQLVAFLDGSLPRLPAKVAVLTIDDAEGNGYDLAFPIFRRHRAPFALGLITRIMDSPYGALSWAEVREMVDTGLCEVASHGHDHRGLALLPESMRQHELNHSRSLIEQHLGLRPEIYFYPLGSVNTAAEASTQAAGYRAAFAAMGDTIDHTTPLYRIPRFRVLNTTSTEAFRVFLRWRERGTL